MYYLVKSELKLGITILLSVPSAALKIESCGSSPFFLLPALLFPIWQDSWAVVRWFMGSALDNLPASNNIKTSHTGKHQTSKHPILENIKHQNISYWRKIQHWTNSCWKYQKHPTLKYIRLWMIHTKTSPMYRHIAMMVYWSKRVLGSRWPSLSSKVSQVTCCVQRQVQSC